jgi:uncharacterized membrane protein
MNLTFEKSDGKIAAYCIIIIGIFLRIQQYLLNKSLWIDECFFAYSIFDKGLLSHLIHQKYNQLSPLGFIFVEKFLVTLFGQSEYILRLFPLLCGIASIILFYKLLKVLYKDLVVVMGLSLFCFSSELIYYSAEAKQYSSDVLITIILAILGLKLQEEKGLSKSNTVILILIAISSVLLSLTSVFTLAAITLYFFINYFLLKQKVNVKENVIFSVSWIICFLIYFVCCYKYHLQNTPLYNYWQVGYISEKITLIKILNDSFNYLSLPYFWFSLSFFLVGVTSFIFRKKHMGLFLVAPILFLGICSCLKIYPFSQRLILFISPLIFLSIGEGLDFITSSKIRFMRIWGVFIAILFLFAVGERFFNELSIIKQKENIKECLSYINKNKKPEDIIYIQYFSQYAFKYYAKDFGFNDEFDLIEDWTNPKYRKDFFKYKRWYKKHGYNRLFISKASKYTTMNRRRIDYELKMLRGYPRVWILFSHDAGFYSWKFKSHLNRYGKQIDFLRIPGVNFTESDLYLYDFSIQKTEQKETFFKKLKRIFTNLIHRKNEK